MNSLARKQAILAITTVLVVLSQSCALRQRPSQDYDTIGARSHPEQPSSGPGGNDYTHAKVSFFRNDAAADGYTLFVPDAPRPANADVVVFLHGLDQWNPRMYGGWIQHLVRKGNIVIYPRYQTSPTEKVDFEDNAAAGIKGALGELKRRCDTGERCIQPNLENFALLGHSYGGTLAANLTVRAEHHGLRTVKALMVNQGWFGSDVRLPEGYGAMPPQTKLLMIVGSTDFIAGSSFARRLMRETAGDRNTKNLVVHHLDKHNLFAPILSGHDEPLSKVDDYDNQLSSGLILLSLPLTRTNAVDYFCYWKLSEALIDCGFRDENCNVAFGNTPAQRFMGKWGDGKPVRELEVRLP